ncbi:phosphoadenosine phosphosulfate reductase domain-containing protein [Nocardia altamirensis]|uniref:phosphoadenosine phosphosulfate reductase domain-containing protein n=1 Tax=Nocardia altamirensis TaxID=472158 RepID=UPI000A069BEE|nr:phosphoadenosine phosphosulfate reductase family protein [Nocardia altamirensis]
MTTGNPRPVRQAVTSASTSVPQRWTPLTGAPRLTDYDIVLVSISGGKDSQAALDVVAQSARAAGILGRVHTVYADLGPAIWAGTAQLAADHSAHYGLTHHHTARTAGPDLLARIEERRRFPDAQRRWCTSDFKTGPIRRVLTELVTEARADGITDRPVRVLEVLGLRAEESQHRRATTVPYAHDTSYTCPCPPCRAHRQAGPRVHGSSNTRRHVDRWLPLHAWTTAHVWDCIDRAGTEPHWAYSVGMQRVSCATCILASRADLERAAPYNPIAFDRAAAIEQHIGHQFRLHLPITEITTGAHRKNPSPMTSQPLVIVIGGRTGS